MFLKNSITKLLGNEGGGFRPLVSVVVVDSRSKTNKDWVDMCLLSIARQTYKNIEIIKIDNTDKKMSIGAAFNRGKSKASGEWILFVGDDDYIAGDYVAVLIENIKSLSEAGRKVTGISTYQTIFNEETRYASALPVMGMFDAEYLKEHDFDESLSVRVDHHFIMDAVNSGETIFVVSHNFGYFHRKHDKNTSKVADLVDEVPDIYIHAMPASFTKDMPAFFKSKGDTVKMVVTSLEPNKAGAKRAIIKDWADTDAIKLAQMKTDCKKILRLHTYETYSKWLPYIDFDLFDSIIFVAEHIKKDVEAAIGGEITNSCIIPHGADINKFTIAEGKRLTNKVAVVGGVGNEKGVQLILEAAHLYKGLEFHFAGGFITPDIKKYCESRGLENVVFHGTIPNEKLNGFYEDKTYILNASPREGFPVSVVEAMAAGLKPLIHNWRGAQEIYGEENIWNSIDDIRAMLIKNKYDPNKYRDFVIKNDFTLDNTLEKMYILTR